MKLTRLQRSRRFFERNTNEDTLEPPRGQGVNTAALAPASSSFGTATGSRIVSETGSVERIEIRERVQSPPTGGIKIAMRSSTEIRFESGIRMGIDLVPIVTRSCYHGIA
ncbi:hypothetical protein EVAR_2903_1 [Eumeta japonica]|uniref:Uncharacterized protein n=1 Tax=Eumeta variegata TaxID=151549 RepID=A0A4C1T0T7_EUMVA|nr:hypothetical protein EVAR_2903_1 [Eumeta japonica]